MNPITRTVATLAAGVLGVGALAVGSTASADESDPTAKREENVSVVLTADDDGDDDTNTGNTGNTGGTGTGSVNRDGSGVSRDGTGSRYTGVSRDRDQSRGDRTKDWTRDGGDRTRDFSQNRTNDGSRNDTR